MDGGTSYNNLILQEKPSERTEGFYVIKLNFIQFLEGKKVYFSSKMVIIIG